MNVTKINFHPLLSMPTSVIMLFAIVLFAGVTVWFYIIFKKNHISARYFQVGIASTLLVTGMFFLAQHNYHSTQSAQIVKQIEKTHNVQKLSIAEESNKLSCNKNSSGNLVAATWKTGKNYHVGVIFGKVEKGKCLFSLKNVG